MEETSEDAGLQPFTSTEEDVGLPVAEKREDAGPKPGKRAKELGRQVKDADSEAALKEPKETRESAVLADRQGNVGASAEENRARSQKDADDNAEGAGKPACKDSDVGPLAGAAEQSQVANASASADAEGSKVEQRQDGREADGASSSLEDQGLAENTLNATSASLKPGAEESDLVGAGEENAGSSDDNHGVDHDGSSAQKQGEGGSAQRAGPSDRQLRKTVSGIVGVLRDGAQPEQQLGCFKKMDDGKPLRGAKEAAA
eukprot:2113675-Rhodomonas_salina.1